MGNECILVSITCKQGRLQLVEGGTLRLMAPHKLILWQVPQQSITQFVTYPGGKVGWNVVVYAPSLGTFLASRVALEDVKKIMHLIPHFSW